MPHKNKAEKAAYMRSYYARTKQRRQQYQKERTKEQRRVLSDLRAQTGCSRCSESDPRCLQFHHLDSEQKEFTISHRPGRMGLKRLLEEVAKCEVLCSNCHFKEHNN